MTIYILVLTFFLSGGLVTSHSVVAPSADDCNAAGTAISADMLGKSVTLQGSDGSDPAAAATILDVEFACVPITKKTPA